MLAIIHALEKWKQYLVGNKFEVKTDHCSLKYLLQQKSLSKEQKKWINKIQAFDFKITYKRGTENVMANALSQNFKDIKLKAMTFIEPEWLKDIQTEYCHDPETMQLIQDINHNKRDTKWRVRYGIIFYENRVYLNKGSTFIKTVLEEADDSPQGGHIGCLLYTSPSPRD